MEHIAQYIAEENDDEAERHQNFVVRVYLLLVVGLTIFADTSKNFVHLYYLEYFRTF
jgi:O-antigen/teichoic acid export membrane protein